MVSDLALKCGTASVRFVEGLFGGPCVHLTSSKVH
jgi:hypothetical protein